MNALKSLLFALLFLVFANPVLAAGTLTPVSSSDQPIGIGSHHVEVVINNGFAATRVTQEFTNPNPHDLEAVFTLPLPESASLSEMSILTGEERLVGEVVEKNKAQKIYEEEKASGNDAGLAGKNGFQNFEFKVARVPSGGKVTVDFLYYQPLEIDTGVGRYVYPLEEGGTDEEAKSFWTRNDKVDGTFSAHFSIKSVWPIDDVRLPGLGGAKVTSTNSGEWDAEYSTQSADLGKDLVLYYRLADNLPGRVEVIPYKAGENKTGTFMAVLTPGVDLRPLKGGSDYVFILDVSGSMAGKLSTLAGGVSQSLGTLGASDRFRIVTFESRARELTRGWVPATAENVNEWSTKVSGLNTNGGTNVYDGLVKGFDGLDNDRATTVILVTDGVTNTGIVDPKAFAKLVSKYDVRLFGFLLGNSVNWPLMRTICNVTGGFYKAVSNTDDILGQIMLAKSKVTHEALHHVELKIDGVKVSEMTDAPKKIYRGQQVVVFGRYHGSGQATLTLKAALTGEDKTYRTSFTLPEVDTDNPVLERLWATAMVEKLELEQDSGELSEKEAQDGIADIGVEYQIVTDHTSMIVLKDEAFKRHGIERRNQGRVALEQEAANRRVNSSVRNYRVDTETPAFGGPAARPSKGGGALSLMEVLVLGMLMVLATCIGAERRREKTDESGSDKG